MGKRDTVFDSTGGKCFYCGCNLDRDNFHMDHFISKDKGGKQKNNLVPACPDCNLCKSNLTLEEFREKIAGYVTKTSHGRILAKYYGIKPTPVKFYFEVAQDGIIQND